MDGFANHVPQHTRPEVVARLARGWGTHSSSVGGRRSDQGGPVGAAIVAWLAQSLGRGRSPALRVGLGRQQRLLRPLVVAWPPLHVRQLRRERLGEVCSVV